VIFFFHNVLVAFFNAIAMNGDWSI